MVKAVHLIGYGSQGAAWATNLRDSGWAVEIYLKSETSASWKAAKSDGFHPRLVTAITGLGEDDIIVFLTPDDVIGPLYREFLAPLPHPLSLVLAHGYAVYSGDLKPVRPEHRVCLLAPKAIGPELRRAYQSARPHDLRAAATDDIEIKTLAQGLGFSTDHLIHCTPEVEAIGDLISEQMLLCGGLFTLTAWTMEEMRKAGVPDALIHEECVTELGLIARLIKDRGLHATAQKISRAAAAGAALTMDGLEKSGARDALAERAARVLDRRFAEEYRTGAWRKPLERLEHTMKDAESRS